jgi:hypothetical protein
MSLSIPILYYQSIRPVRICNQDVKTVKAPEWPGSYRATNSSRCGASRGGRSNAVSCADSRSRPQAAPAALPDDCSHVRQGESIGESRSVDVGVRQVQRSCFRSSRDSPWRTSRQRRGIFITACGRALYRLRRGDSRPLHLPYRRHQIDGDLRLPPLRTSVRPRLVTREASTDGIDNRAPTPRFV